MYISVYCKQFYCRIEGCVPQFSLPLSACISLSLPSLSSYHRVQSQAEPSASVGAPERVSKPESRPPTTDPVWLGRVPKRMAYVTDEEARSLLGPESCHLSFDVAALYPVGGVPCLRFRSSEVSDLRRPSSLEGLLRGWVASATPRFTFAGSDSICWASSMVREARYL